MCKSVKLSFGLLCSVLLASAHAGQHDSQGIQHYSIQALPTKVDDAFIKIAAVSPSGQLLVNVSHDVGSSEANSLMRPRTASVIVPSDANLASFIPKKKSFGETQFGLSMNSLGDIVGYTYPRFSPWEDRAASWIDGKLTMLQLPRVIPNVGPLEMLRAHAVAINRQRQIVGNFYYESDTGAHERPTLQALLWCSAEAAPIVLPGFEGKPQRGEVAGINDAGEVVGWTAGRGTIPVRWNVSQDCKKISGPVTLSPEVGSATGINASGTTLGVLRHSDGTSNGRIWRDTAEIELAPTSSRSADLPLKINGRGTSVGTTLNLDSRADSVVSWDADGRVTDLYTASDAKTQGWDSFNDVFGIDEAGNIFGAGVRGGERAYFKLVPIAGK